MQTEHSSNGPASGSRVPSGSPIIRGREGRCTSHGAVLARAMTLLIDTNAVAAQDRVEFWAKSSCDAYHPLHIGTDSNDRFWARMWADHLGPLGVYRITAGPNTMRRTPRDIAAGDPECLHLSLLIRGRLHGAQQHRATTLGPGDITSYDTSQPAIFRADAPFDLLVLRLPKATLGKHAGKVSRLTAVTIPGNAGLPRLAARFFCEAANGLADGSISNGDTGLAEHVIDLVRRLYVDLDATRVPRPGVHRGAARRSGAEPGGARACLLHLDALSAPGVRGRRAQGVRFHPLGAARPLPARSDRSRVRRSADLGDRQPVGASERAALQPAVPPGLWVLAARVPEGCERGRGLERIA
jgi:AraC-binding-like domain